MSKGVFVLKSEFNSVWKFFDVKELGKTITSSWQKWLTKAELTSHLRQWDESRSSAALDPGALAGTVSAATIPLVVRRADGTEFVRTLPDVRKLDVLDGRWIVSRKRTLTLNDLVNSWKNLVLQRVAEAQDSQAISPKARNSPETPDVPIRNDSSDRESSPEVGDAWRSAHLGNFGRF